ncbi:MAG: hypothetical protein RIG62_16525 [Cyclobacteriaceae bacterium]
MEKATYLILTIAFLSFLGCQEEDMTADAETSGTHLVTSEALLSWEGEYEVDGCGFFITIGDQTYKPKNEDFIGDSFKVSSTTGTEVSVTYEILDTAVERYCGDLPAPLVTPGIKLFALEKGN